MSTVQKRDRASSIGEHRDEWTIIKKLRSTSIKVVTLRADNIKMKSHDGPVLLLSVIDDLQIEIEALKAQLKLLQDAK